MQFFPMRATRPFHLPRSDQSNTIWQEVQIMQLLKIYFSPAYRSQYSPQHPVLKHPQSVFLP
jgi:hypothetical protein